MRSLVFCPEPSLSSSRSSRSSSENDAAVKPISALALFRIAINRRNRRKEEEVINHNRNNDNGNRNNNNNNSTLSSSSSSSSLIYLLRNPFFSLPLGITEIAGPAGVGKTQIALSLCADCVLQHHNHHNRNNDENSNNNNNNNTKKKKAVYIQLGGSSKFLQTASRRVQSMIQSRIITTTGDNGDRQQRNHHQEADDDGIVHDCLTRVLVRWICNSDELMDLLITNLDRLLHQHPTISIVVLDGIANLFRFLPEYESQSSSQQQQQQQQQHYSNNNPWHHRAITFFQISNLCKELSSKYEVPFVIINECTTKIPNDTTTTTTTTDTGGTTFRRCQQQQKQLPVLEPALGLAWSQCVNCRFFVRRLGVMTTCNNNNNSSSDQQQQQQQQLSSSTATSTNMLTSTTNRSNNNKSNSNSNNNNNKVYGRRLLHCLKAPHVSSEHAKLEFTIDRSGIIPI
jgi:RecA/RadA recombinase